MSTPLCKLCRLEILPEEQKIKAELKLEGEVDLIRFTADYTKKEDGIKICNVFADREWLAELLKAIPATSRGKEIKLGSSVADILNKFL